jgi:hypothetical protein
MPDMGLKQKKTKNCYFIRTRRHKTPHNFYMKGQFLCKNDRIHLGFPLSMKKTIFEHFLREPIRGRAQNCQKNLDLKELKVLKFVETNTCHQKGTVSP